MLKRLRSVVNQSVALVLLIVHAPLASADILAYFRDEQGKTNWQYVANWSSGILILTLTIVVVTLAVTHFKLRKANRSLKAIKNVLEQRVAERTSTLNESNKLLTQANKLLQGEITEHKETATLLRSSEGYIKNILESMPLMLIGLNHNLQVTQWNREAENATGVPSQDALGKKLWEAYPSITVFPDQIERVLTSGKPETIKHSQRGQLYFDITIYPLNDQTETGLVILIDDVSQRIQAENMLIQRDKLSSMGELAATMAHDISAPLADIVADVESVIERIKAVGASGSASEADDLVTKLQHAAQAGGDVEKIISALLEFSRGSVDERSPIQLPALIDDSLELAEDVLSAPSGLRFRDIRVEKNYEDGLPELPGYKTELQQVFLSLFRNACHAMGRLTDSAREPIVKIEVAERYDAIWVKIQHNGSGLDDQEQRYIFEPFFNNDLQGDGPDSEDYDPGNRLSYPYFIVTEHHNGQMAVTSDPDVGTTFHLSFQLRY
ncbi:MAG: two-component system sensor histidine kinase NtrB [bacterium]